VVPENAGDAAAVFRYHQVRPRLGFEVVRRDPGLDFGWGTFKPPGKIVGSKGVDWDGGIGHEESPE
jgi:hypothetical protein